MQSNDDNKKSFYGIAILINFTKIQFYNSIVINKYCINLKIENQNIHHFHSSAQISVNINSVFASFSKAVLQN
jgi:hypothetical protein